jgi:hypothetical protein
VARAEREAVNARGAVPAFLVTPPHASDAPPPRSKELN